MTTTTEAIRERRVAVPGVQLHLREAGEGPALLLLHGWPQHGAMWEPLIGDLAKDHHVLVPDLRGFGRSSVPTGGYDKHRLARDILALLDAEGIERATIVGHDWGGWIAWLLALEHPERVERFADLDVPPPWSRDSSLDLKRMPLQILFGSYQYVISSPWLGERFVSSPDWIHRFIRAASSRREVWTDAQLEQYSRPLTERARARASVLLYRTFLLREVPSLARGTYTENDLTVPGLVIMGADSPLLKAMGAPKEHENVEVEFLDGVGHYVVDEAPDEVLARLRSFLGSNTASIAE